LPTYQSVRDVRCFTDNLTLLMDAPPISRHRPISAGVVLQGWVPAAATIGDRAKPLGLSLPMVVRGDGAGRDDRTTSQQ
jgi:hypothetical protein